MKSSRNDLSNITQKKKIHFHEFFPIPEYFYSLYLIVNTASIFSLVFDLCEWTEENQYNSKLPLKMSNL